MFSSGEPYRGCMRNSGKLCLGPGLPPLSDHVTMLECHGRHTDPHHLITAYVMDITARLTHQMETGVILIDCFHQFHVKKLTVLLADKVRREAEDQNRRMKEAGTSRAEREKTRMMSSKQWVAVRKALSRC